MGYQIVFVDHLPEGHDFVLVRLPGKVVVAYRRSAVSPAVVEASWAAYDALMRSPLPIAG